MTETLEPSSCAPGEPLTTPDEADLGAATAGDRQAFDRLVVRHQQAVINTAYYHAGDYQDALEISQESFVKAFRALSGFRSQASFRTWILRITVNTAHSFKSRMRAKKRSGPGVRISLDPPDEERGAIEIADRGETPERLLMRKETKEAIERAIAGLKPDARNLVVLRDISGLSYEEISRSLQMPIGTVKSGVHRARLQLREVLKSHL